MIIPSAEKKSSLLKISRKTGINKVRLQKLDLILQYVHDIVYQQTSRTFRELHLMSKKRYQKLNI
jgi:hypothetical protein